MMICAVALLGLLWSASLATAIYAVIQFNQRLDRLERINCVLLVETRHDHAAFAAHQGITITPVSRLSECAP